MCLSSPRACDISDLGGGDHGVSGENIPYFCFFCGFIGHAQRECLEDSAELGDVHFG